MTAPVFTGTEKGVVMPAFDTTFAVGCGDGYFDLNNVVITVQVVNGNVWLFGVSPTGLAIPAPVYVRDSFGVADVQMCLHELVRAANRHRFQVDASHGGNRVA